MVTLTSIDEFGNIAHDLIRGNPKGTRFTTKYRKNDQELVLKVTDDVKTYKIKITTDNDFKASQRLITSIMHLMTSQELMK